VSGSWLVWHVTSSILLLCLNIDGDGMTGVTNFQHHIDYTT
jgi:hypothetical protein